MISTTSPSPLLLVSAGSSNPSDIAKLLRDFADVLESQSAIGELVTYYYRGNGEDARGGEVKVKWTRTAKDDISFAHLKTGGEPKPHGETREVCGMTFSTEEIRTIPLG